MAEREKLIEQLLLFYDEQSICLTAESTADFILADRKRICEPLIGLNGEDVQRGCICCVGLMKRINETLKLAGAYDRT